MANKPFCIATFAWKPACAESYVLSEGLALHNLAWYDIQSSSLRLQLVIKCNAVAVTNEPWLLQEKLSKTRTTSLTDGEQRIEKLRYIWLSRYMLLSRSAYSVRNDSMPDPILLLCRKRTFNYGLVTHSERAIITNCHLLTLKVDRDVILSFTDV